MPTRAKTATSPTRPTRKSGSAASSRSTKAHAPTMRPAPSRTTSAPTSVASARKNARCTSSARSETSAMPRLRRVDCAEPGIRRVKRGRGFAYVDAGGSRVTDAATLQRISDLAIPPAWTDVWICTATNGHIQATGTDAAGRRQYRYHDAWRSARDRAKHERMLDFATALPAARARMLADLDRAELD